MKDLLELLKRVFGRNCSPRKPKHVCDSELYINVNGCLDPDCPVSRKRKPLPDQPPPGPPPAPKESHVVKNKDRITDLEKELKELREQSDNQVELLARLVQELGSLQRDIANANILPEK